ncbi:MAG: signal recognition particle-docking protein FtsY [Buchnera aphidicola (Eriosoma harunire)]
MKNNNLFTRLKNSLYKTSKKFSTGLTNLFLKKNTNDDFIEELEEKLLLSDMSIITTELIIDNIKNYINRHNKYSTNFIIEQLKQEMFLILNKVDKPIQFNIKKKPFVILVVGVNGVGKTTTIGKLAKKYSIEGKRVVLAAADTFRPAAIDQLQGWGDLYNIPVISSTNIKSDPASVVFNALDYTISKDIDILIIDTAGRLHNKLYLMNELKKIIRVIKKKIMNSPHEIMLIIDASTGQNTIQQTKFFHNSLKLTGISLTKLDGTAKGGVIFSLANDFCIPIRYIGIGEKITDLREFNSHDFIQAFFDK